MGFLRNIAALLVFIAGTCNLLYASNSLTKVELSSLPNNRVRVDFKFEHSITPHPASFMTKSPARIIVDFADAVSKLSIKEQSKVLNMSGLLNYKVISVANRVRVVLDVAPGSSYFTDANDNSYAVIIQGTTSSLSSNKKEVFLSAMPQEMIFAVKKIDFRGIEKQGGRLIIDLNNPKVPVDIEQHANEIILQFAGTVIPKYLLKQYDVRDFHVPTVQVDTKQLANKAQVVMTNEGDYNYFAYQVNNQFIVDVFPLSEEEKDNLRLKKKIFTGKLISLNFQDIPVRSVLQLLADFTKINIVVSDKVTGNITLRLNDVPWDQALDIILTTQGLDKRQLGNVMLIDKASELAARETAELKEAQNAKKLAPLRAALLQMNYAKATDIATMLKDKTNSLLSERGTVSVDVRTNTIWIQDTFAKIEEIRDLLKELDIPVKQVVIEARIVNVIKDCAEDLGIKFGVSKPEHISGTIEGANQMAQGTPPADVPVAQRLNLDLGALPLDATPASIGIALAKLGNGVLLDLELSALESEGRAEIVASPRLMTTNQQPALIESGEDIPYQEATSSGATAVSFKKAVLSLKVTPQITPDGKLLMALQINHDSDSGRRVQGVPIIITKAIDTNVLVDNGQTIVLGGIYKQDKNNNITRVPFLGSLPLFGRLFSRTSVKNRNEELLIFITPKIVTNNFAITNLLSNAEVKLKATGVDTYK